MEKDTDEISPDRSFVADQDPSRFPTIMHKLNAALGTPAEEYTRSFAPLIKRPMVPVEVKISGLMRRMSDRQRASMKELLEGEPTLPDLVASFMGILELLKLRRILIDKEHDGTDGENSVHGSSTRFLLNPDPPTDEGGMPKDLLLRESTPGTA
jgi:hypothetical protein